MTDVTVTQNGVACLYDSTSGVAFGPTFDTQYDAEAFLEHLAAIGERDARVIPAIEIAQLKEEWERELEVPL